MAQSFDHDPSAEQRNAWATEQNNLKRLIEDNDRVSFDAVSLEGLSYIGGVDLSFPQNDHEHAVACLVVLSYPMLEVVYVDYLEITLHLPYIPGFLAFREVDPLLELLNRMKQDRPEIYPQILLVDGNGRLHPRTCGIACHLGVLADLPAIGVAKNFLVIDDEGPLLQMRHVKVLVKELQGRGDRLILRGTSGTVYGAAVRTSISAPNPVFISQGHRISLDTAVRVVLATCRYRIPEPIRRADLDSRAYIREKKQATNEL
ncbi:hypothetical protein EC973_003538 [Apophysomyces ossiformis]|uniref:Endonuclease V n=1 Tax=Apophysomyces ossiformis TaxID=679940 RepID=A0A8H7BR61_9FUNG|nr:hypothetical protein EC973_003538 [Apophysomyces ossiformis]